MSRELLILRHAKSDWDPAIGRDFERPLAKRGRRAAKRMGKWVRSQGMLPDSITCSPALRARQTALRLTKAAELDERTISWEPRVYEASLETLLDILASTSSEPGCVLLIGHNPGLEHLVRYLSDDSLDAWDASNLMPTACLARLVLPADWGGLTAACAEVASISRPRELFDD
ncbi:MAG: phosphohistidine phosphatase [Rhodospirillaceae bacterium]|nr:phosphohistidine phosphatase [Rhodospirillaceae bacterium]